MFGGGFNYEQIDSLESDLRTGFLLYCNRTPALAAEYLRSLLQHRHHDRVARGILKFSGALAQAAPAELAELTATTLIPKPPRDRYPARYELREAFDYSDHEFLSPSPAQGPFLELLLHAPEHGLALVRRLVDHAIAFYANGHSPDGDTIVITYADSARVFPWGRSYTWSREGAGHYSVTSGLMALEAWGHHRIEADEPFDKVLSDVLGPPGAPAAYLLVAVDLMLSHWPKSCEAAVPFLACPELLCLDRRRQLLDNFKYPDIFGLNALQKEPPGVTSLDKLKKYPSRRQMFEHLIGCYGAFGPTSCDRPFPGSYAKPLRVWSAQRSVGPWRPCFYGRPCAQSSRSWQLARSVSHAG